MTVKMHSRIWKNEHVCLVSKAAAPLAKDCELNIVSCISIAVFGKRADIEMSFGRQEYKSRTIIFRLDDSS